MQIDEFIALLEKHSAHVPVDERDGWNVKFTCLDKENKIREDFEVDFVSDCMERYGPGGSVVVELKSIDKKNVFIGFNLDHWSKVL